MTIAGTAEGMKISIAADDTSIHAAVKPRGPPAPLTITGRSGAQGVIRIKEARRLRAVERDCQRDGLDYNASPTTKPKQGYRCCPVVGRPHGLSGAIRFR